MPEIGGVEGLPPINSSSSGAESSKPGQHTKLKPSLIERAARLFDKGTLGLDDFISRMNARRDLRHYERIHREEIAINNFIRNQRRPTPHNEVPHEETILTYGHDLSPLVINTMRALNRIGGFFGRNISDRLLGPKPEELLVKRHEYQRHETVRPTLYDQEKE